MSSNNTSLAVDAQPSTPSRLDRLWQFLEADPVNTNLLRDIARESMSTGAFDQAVRALDKLAEQQASDANDEAAAIHAQIKLGRVEQACERGHRALERWPGDAALRVETARALLNSHCFDEVIAQTEGEFEDPILAQIAGELRLQAMWHKGETEAASGLAAQLVEQFPDNPRITAQYSALLYDENRSKEAFEQAHRAYAMSPLHAYSALHVLASERLLNQDVPGALKLLDEAQRARTDDGRVWLLKGSAKLMSGQMDDAMVDLNRALEIFPDHPGTHLTVAWVYITQGQLDQAEVTVHNAIEASPAFGESHGTLAVILVLKGQQDEARHCIRRATLLDKSGLSARYAQSILDGNPTGSVEEIFKDLIQRVKV